VISSSSSSSSSGEACTTPMEVDYNFPKEVSTNPEGGEPLSSDDESEVDSWSPTDSDDTPTVTVTISGGDDPEDTFINTINIISTEGVEEVTVVVINENGDRSEPITLTPNDDGSIVGDIKEDGVKVEITITPEDPTDPSTVSVSGVGVEACMEGSPSSSTSSEVSSSSSSSSSSVVSSTSSPQSSSTESTESSSSSSSSVVSSSSSSSSSGSTESSSRLTPCQQPR